MARTVINLLGAGLCGSLLSILLARRGHNVTLWERQPDPREAATVQGRSINLALSARGMRALRLAGLQREVEKLLVPMRGRMVHHADGSTELQPYGQRDDEVIHSVSRGALNRLLLDTAADTHGVQTVFQHAAESYASRSNVLYLRDLATGNERRLVSAPLIAADGAGSIVRRACGADGRLRAREELLAHGYKELTLPAAADGRFQLAPDALHIWPRGGFMLIALPNPGGDFTLTLFLPNDGERSFAALPDARAVEAFFAEHFRDVHGLLPTLAADFERNPIGVLGTVRCDHWHLDGELLLIGDAAHAIVPFHGQGMNLAFEDCVVLDSLLDERTDWQDIFRRFEAMQRRNANAIADMALENYVEMRDRVRDPQFVLQKQLAFEIERRLPELFIPRYSMVMFHDEIPYAEAQRRGALQQQLLKRFAAGAASLREIDVDAAVAEARELL